MRIAYRFWIGCMVFFTTFTCYTTRVNFSVSIVSMTKGKTKTVPYCKRPDVMKKRDGKEPPLPDYGPRYDWDERIQGQLLGAYFYGYVFFNLLSGPAADFFGPFKVILFVHCVATVANTATVFAPDIHWGLVFACRFILGICGAMVYPSLQVLIAHWAPPLEKGKFVSALAGNVLGMCTTWIIVGIITTRYGWNWGFFFVSIENAIFCIVFALIVRDDPDDHKWVKEEEVKYIQDAQAGSVSKQKLIAPYKDIFSNGPYWMLVLATFANDYGLYLQITLAPKFLSDVIGFKLDTTGGLAALPPLMKMIFGLIVGYVGDVLLKKEICRKVVIRKSCGVLSHVLPGICLIGLTFFKCDFLPVMILLTLSLGLNGASVQTILINGQDLAPNFAGSIYAINSFFSGMTGFIIPAINAEFTKDENGIKEWSYTFIIGGCVYCAGGIMWILFGSVEEQSFNRKLVPAT